MAPPKSSSSSKPSGSKASTVAVPAAAGAAEASSSAASTSNSAASTPEPSSEAFPDPKTDLPAYLLKLQSALQPLTRNAAAIPNHGDLAFHRSMDRKLAKKLDAESDRVLRSISTLSSWIASDPRAPKIPLATSNQSSSSSQKQSRIDMDLDMADVTTNQSFLSNLGELVDHLLESADTCLDEYTGKLAPRNLANGGGAATIEENGGDEKGATGRLQAMAAVQNGRALPKTGNLPSWVLNAPIPPPQKGFTTKADNSAHTLWQPKLKYGKPNAKVPLGHVNPPRLGADGQPLPRGPRRGMYCAEGDPLDNPYYHEILHADPPTHALSKPDPSSKDNPPPPLNEKDPSISTDACPFQWVSTKAQIEELRDHLDQDRVKEIAIDLEHHSYRTYQGIVCLMQLSTRWGDWIIDTLSDDVRQHAELLNSSFTHPDKVKVLHGANHDVLWLQRDLGLYLVNLFDTYHATNVLMFPSHGLNYLMARYCNFDADKRYQLADWRIRPLPKEMLYYARSDTHTLLYIYDNLRHELMEAGGVDAIRDVFTRSKDVAMATYAKEEWDSQGETREGWRSVWRKWGGEAALGTEDRRELSQMKREERLVRALHKWRDAVARQEDESPRYILGANNLMMLAARAPTKPEGVLACVPPNATALKKRTTELAKLIEEEMAAWNQDQQRISEEKKQKLAAGLLANGKSDEDEMDMGEAVERVAPDQGVDPQQQNKGEDAPVASHAISAISNVAGTDPKVDVSIWSNDVTFPASTAAAAPRSSIRGAVRSFASNLFGRATPAAAAAAASSSSSSSSTITTSTTPSATRTLQQTSSKLFGTSSTSSVDSHSRAVAAAGSRVEAKIDAVKAGFLDQVGGLLGVSSNNNRDNSNNDENVFMQQPENVAFAPQDERATSIAAPHTSEQDVAVDVEDDDDDDKSSEKEDFIVVSAAKSKSKSKSQPHSRPGSGQGEAITSSPTKKELKKKRKAEEALARGGAEFTTTTTSGSSKKRKEKFEAEFDFASAPNAFESSPASASGAKNRRKEEGGGSGGKKNIAANNNKKKKDDKAAVGVDEKIFRQPRDRARRKTGMGSTM